MIPSLYKQFKKYGSDLIRAKSKKPATPFTSQEKDVLDFVWTNYGKYCGYYLSQITHGKSSDRMTPWKRYYIDGEKAKIDNDAIKQYYRRLCESGKCPTT